jgi:hypothetical protein
MTIMTVPSKRATDLVLILCDECKKDIQVAQSAPLPRPWREVSMKGWIGVMHACSDEHEEAIRKRHERSGAS